MNLTRWEPTFRTMEDVANQFFRSLGPRFSPLDRGEEAMTVADWSPFVDIQETDKEYLVKVEIPEVKKEDVKITVEEGVLTLQGERKMEKEEKGKRYHRTERFYGSFFRSFTLPVDADETMIHADFKDGMLYVHMPKSEKAKPKVIEVKPS